VASMLLKHGADPNTKTTKARRRRICWTAPGRCVSSRGYSPQAPAVAAEASPRVGFRR